MAGCVSPGAVRVSSPEKIIFGLISRAVYQSDNRGLRFLTRLKTSAYEVAWFSDNMTVNVFAVPSKIYRTPSHGIIAHFSVFFICFRECLETSIIVSVLLAFLKQTLGAEGDRAVYKRLVKQVRPSERTCISYQAAKEPRFGGELA